MLLAIKGQDCQPTHIFNSVLSVVRSRAHLFPFEKNLQVLLPFVTVLGLSVPLSGSKLDVAKSILYLQQIALKVPFMVQIWHFEICGINGVNTMEMCKSALLTS